MMEINTPDSDSYDSFWMTVYDDHSLVFTVQACSNAQLILCELPGIAGSNCFEYVIGYNQNKETILRKGKGGQVVSTVSSPNVLNCNDLKALWVSWSDNIIAFGRGITAGVSRILNYKDTSQLKINAFSVATVGVTAHWQFHEVDGQSPFCYKLTKYFS